MAMTAEEFRKTIAAFGMSHAGFSRFLGMNASTIKDYATGQSRVPDLIEIIFALMRQFNVSPADARRIAGLPTENYGDRRRNRVYVGRKRKFVAEVARSAAEQRELIRERVRADRERRKPKLSDNQRQEVIKRRAAGETISSIAKSYGVQKGMIARVCKAAGVRIAPEYRELIHERIRAGRERAMANGVQFGRKPKLSDNQRQEVIKRRAAGETISSIAKSYGVQKGMIARVCKAAGVRIAPEYRELIHERIRAGRERAMANGVQFGRRPKLSDNQRQEVIKRRAAGETISSIAKSYGVHISMIARLARTVGVRINLAPEDHVSGVPATIATPSGRD